MSHAKQIYYNNLRENLRNMNPKLKSLAVEAGAYIDGNNIITSPMDVAKFAELIVRECADQCMNVLDYHAILERFGVEEHKGWVCPKCGIDRTKAVCPKGHTAAITGECPMTAEAQ